MLAALQVFSPSARALVGVEQAPACPREVDEFLYRHPKVEQVQDFGIPDEKYGEEVCAWVVLKAGQTATEEELRDFCRGQISHFKVPRHVRFVADLPMTVTGKAQKFKMR